MTNPMRKPTKRESFHLIRNLLYAAQDIGIQIQADMLIDPDVLDRISYETLDACLANEVSLLDRKAEAAQARATERKIEGDELRDQIYNLLPTDEFVLINDIVAQINDPEITNAMVSSRLSQLVELEKVEKSAMNIPSQKPGGKSKRLTTYRKIAD